MKWSTSYLALFLDKNHNSEEDDAIEIAYILYSTIRSKQSKIFFYI